MNGIGLMLYLYVRFLIFILGLIPLYVIIKYFKLERDKVKNNAIIQYRDNLKNLMPKAFRNLIISFLFVIILWAVFLYVFLKLYVLVIFMAIIMIALMCFVGFYKFPVYISNDGFYFEKLSTWRAFEGYEKIEDKIKLIGKKYISSDVYLKDKGRKLEEILKRYFKH
ncbi:hypothetical protein ACO3UB_02340 [Methanocaldococcus sp. 16A]